ncbi:hypothetical protein ACEPAF_5649 [Sanghuangporus sanghuang]
MLLRYLSFVNIRIFALVYATCLLLLTFAIVLFVLPTAGKKHVPALAVIAIVSIFVGFAACGALIVPKTQCCGRKTRALSERKMHVGIEVLCSFASLPLLATAVVLEAGLAAQTPRKDQNRQSTGNALDPQAEHTLSSLLLFFSCSTAMVIMTYTTLITGLAVYTQKRTDKMDIWFSDASSRRPAFVYPPSLRFLQPASDDDASESDVERAGQSQRVRVEQLEIDSTLQTILHQIRSHERSRHTLAPDCACGEKLPWGPRQPDEYRAVSQIYARVWTIIAERDAQERARVVGGGQRSGSAPVPIFRLPTERERRRTVFLVAFDAAHLVR